MTINDKILRRIRAKKRGWVFIPKDFIDISSRSAIDVTLYRLAKKGIIRRLDQGIYDFPMSHPKLGILAPNPDLIAKAIAKKKGGTIQSSGARAANQLGIDTQLPTKPTYFTSSTSVKKKIANYPITLRHSKYTSNEKLNPNVINVINALLHLKKNNIHSSALKQIEKILTKKDKSQLKKNMSMFPDWLAPIILELTRKKNASNIG